MIVTIIAKERIIKVIVRGVGIGAIVYELSCPGIELRGADGGIIDILGKGVYPVKAIVVKGIHYPLLGPIIDDRGKVIGGWG
jgi:hypothetical protein